MPVHDASPGCAWLWGALLAGFLIPMPGFAKDFFLSDIGPIRGQLDLELAYGLLLRTEDQDPALIGEANAKGAEAFSPNYDDGNLNYDKNKIVHNMVRSTGELTLGWGNFGAFLRGYAFYDYENEDNDRERTELSADAMDLVASDAELLDAYLSVQFITPGPTHWPVQLRLGDQVVNWGESTFFAGGVNITSPLNLPLFRQPTGTQRDLRRPVGMLWGSVGITELFSIEGYYGYDWDKTLLTPVGSFHNANDVTAPGRQGVFFGYAQYSDLGTDLDERFDLPPGTLGFDPTFFSVWDIETDRPKDHGQWGVSLQGVFPGLNDANIGVYFANYHWQTEVIGGRIPEADVIARYTPEGIAHSARELQDSVPGLGFEDALNKTLGVAIGKYSQEVKGQTWYPEDIKMFGLSFNTTTIQTGTALSGEISHHLDVPLLIDDSELSFALLAGDPTSGPGFLDNQITNGRAPDPGETIKGFIERDKTMVVLGFAQFLGRILGASQSAILGEVGWLHVHDMPSKSKLRLDAPGTALSGNEAHETDGIHPRGAKAEKSKHFADADSWGYRLAASMTYPNAFGGVTLRPRVVWRHDVDGNSPANLATFRQDIKGITVGLGGSYLSGTLTGDLSYFSSFGAGRHNLFNDRDYLSFTVRFTY
jgi:hypothetical protein